MDGESGADRTVLFYFDVSSPFTYLAGTQIDSVCARAGVACQWIPIYVPGIYQATGNVPPVGQVPARRRWLQQDLRDWASIYGVAVNFPPPVFPINSLQPQRALVATATQAKMRHLAIAFFEAYWVHGEDISDRTVLLRAAERAGYDTTTLVDGVESAAVKATLRANTDGALAAGVFGTPTFLWGEKLYFGNDRLFMLERHIIQNQA